MPLKASRQLGLVFTVLKRFNGYPVVRRTVPTSVLLTSVAVGSFVSSSADMSEKHLANGSKCPPLQPGKLRLYGMKYCPYTHRTRLVLAAKNVPHETVYINVTSKPDWYLEKNPLGLVPTVEINGDIIYESDVTSELVDSLYGDTLLSSEDPIQRAKDKNLLLHWGKVVTPCYKLYRATPEDVPALEQEMLNQLDYMEAALDTRGTSFYSGPKPGMVDYMIWPYVERFPMVEQLASVKFDWASRFPRLGAWRERMLEDPAVRSVLISTETHLKFIRSYVEGCPLYDM